MQNTELKPCPFCNGKAHMRVKSHGYSNQGFSISAELGCNKCCFYMTGENKFDIDAFMNIHMLEGNDGINKMIEKWNRRV